MTRTLKSVASAATDRYLALIELVLESTDIDAAARALGVPRSTIYQALRRGRARADPTVIFGAAGYVLTRTDGEPLGPEDDERISRLASVL